MVAVGLGFGCLLVLLSSPKLKRPCWKCAVELWIPLVEASSLVEASPMFVNVKKKFFEIWVKYQ